MHVLNLLGLLLLATRPTRSVSTDTGHGWSEPLGSNQANPATKIASSTFSDIMSPSQEWAMPHDEAQDLPFTVFEYSTWEPNWLEGNSLLEFDFSTINRVDPFGKCSLLNEWDSSPGSKIDASHISIDSQQLSQEGENLACLIDPNQIPIESEILPSKDSLDNVLPDNRNARQFNSSSKNLADWNPSTSSNRDASHISIDGQQSIESVECETLNSRIENTINSKNQLVDVHENVVLDGFRNALGLRKLCPPLHWDLDEVKDYESLCVFLGKETNQEQVEFHNSVAMTKYIMELQLRGKSGRDTVQVKQKNIDVPHPRLITKATTTLQKLILISNFVLKLASCTRSLIGINSRVILFLKRSCIPILQCLVKCCGKDIDLFQTRWGGRFNHKGFGDKWCPGPVPYLDTCGSQRMKILKNPEHNDSSSLDLEALSKAVSISKTSEDKLSLCWKFNEIYQSSDRTTQIRHRAYYARSSEPIWGCFVHHCGKNLNEWFRKWGTKFAHSQFRQRKCQGLMNHPCGEENPPFDIEERRDLRFTSTRNLLPVFSKILQQYDQYMDTKLEPMRPPHPDLNTLVRQCIRPINICLLHHCNGSVDEFARRWGESLSYYRFGILRCPGPEKTEDGTCQYNRWSFQD